jgi:hypothetical protein
MEMIKEKFKPGIADRLNNFLAAILDDSKFNPAFLPIIKNLAKNYLTKASEEDLNSMLCDMRDKFIPWILFDRLPDDKN